jgi:hypothetical protein
VSRRTATAFAHRQFAVERVRSRRMARSVCFCAGARPSGSPVQRDDATETRLFGDGSDRTSCHRRIDGGSASLYGNRAVPLRGVVSLVWEVNWAGWETARSASLRGPTRGNARRFVVPLSRMVARRRCCAPTARARLAPDTVAADDCGATSGASSIVDERAIARLEREAAGEPARSCGFPTNGASRCPRTRGCYLPSRGCPGRHAARHCAGLWDASWTKKGGVNGEPASKAKLRTGGVNVGGRTLRVDILLAVRRSGRRGRGRGRRPDQTPA